MKAPRAAFECSSCGNISAKWQGQCVRCGEWNTLEERAEGASEPRAPVSTVRLGEIDSSKTERLSSGLGEFDSVLGGGFVPGSVVLLGGDPGVGKSTLLLQVAAAMSSTHPVLYVSGEESARQIAMRAERLNVDASEVELLSATSAEDIVAAMRERRPALAVIDSIQTMQSLTLTAASGSVAQVRACSGMLARAAKECGAATVLVGHVTKEGTLAGPKVLEHMVDTVLYFEGDAGYPHRMIRAFKNRFGAINEIAVFAMLDSGLRGIANPSRLFLSPRGSPIPGTGVLVAQEGTRPLLVEIQALTNPNPSGGSRRISVGLESERLAMLLAVLDRHAGIGIGGHDVFTSVVGGVRISEPASDLAVALAVVSSLYARPLPDDMAWFGEIGLTGEIRQVTRAEERVREAVRLGFTRLGMPAPNVPRKPVAGAEPVGFKTIGDAVAWMGRNPARSEGSAGRAEGVG